MTDLQAKYQKLAAEYSKVTDLNSVAYSGKNIKTCDSAYIFVACRRCLDFL